MRWPQRVLFVLADICLFVSVIAAVNHRIGLAVILGIAAALLGMLWLSMVRRHGNG